jgi:hypothetical protein
MENPASKPQILFACGHRYGPRSDVIRLEDYDCYDCDPETFHLRVMFFLMEHGFENVEGLEEELRRAEFAKYHIH